MSAPIPQAALDAQAKIDERRRTTTIETAATLATAESIGAPLLRIMQSIPAERKAEREDFERRQKATKAKKLFDGARCPKRHTATADIDRAGPWGDKENALAAKMGSGFLVALVGTRGCGKTQIAVELIRRSAASGKRALYCTAIEFFMEIKASYGHNATGSEKEVIEKYVRPALLVIDEMGKRGDTEWENRLLYELLNRRYNSIADTLIISNQEVTELESALGPSIVSRMRETGGVIECAWESYRK